MYETLLPIALLLVQILHLRYSSLRQRGYGNSSSLISVNIPSVNIHSDVSVNVTNQCVEEHTYLVEYVEEERSWRSAGLGTRIKWWMFGKDN